MNQDAEELKADYIIEKIKGTLNVRFYCLDDTRWGKSSIGSDGYIESDHIHTREAFELFKIEGGFTDVHTIIVKDETFEQWKSRKQTVSSTLDTK
jgi:hypothetical protein